MACDHLVKVSFTPRAGCQIPRDLLAGSPSLQLMLQISSPSSFFGLFVFVLFVCLFCWQLLGPNSNLQLFMQLKPYCQHPYPQYTTIPGVWAELFRCHHEKGREMGWGSQKQGFLGSSAKAHIVAELLFLLLTSIWGGFSFGIINRSQLAVCLLLSGQTQHSGRGKYHGIFLAI